MKYKEIQNSQEDYLNLLKKFEGIIYSDTINQLQIAMILDEIECFWLSRKDILSYELNTLTYQKECCIVSGSIYVNFEDNEHYMYKALGDEHFISEPFLKLEHFFRVPSIVFHNDSIDVFKRTYNDVLKLLTEHQNLFYILPIEQIINLNIEERGNLLHEFYISFLNTMMDEDYKTLEEFLNKYTSYQELEDNMSSFFKNNIIFENQYTDQVSLKDKTEEYINTHGSIKKIMKDYNEGERFFLSLQTFVFQITDIIICSIYTNLTPLIRYTPTFTYLTIVMDTFRQDKNIQAIIEKSIIFYIFYMTVEKEMLISLNFNDFYKHVNEKKYLNVILQKIRDKKINIFESGIKDVEVIIKEEYSSFN